MMSRLIWASMLGNLLLAASSWFLFNSNSDLKIETGGQAAQIRGYAKTTVAQKEQLQQCTEETVRLVTEHRQQIRTWQDLALRNQRANQERLDQLLEEKGRMTTLIKGIRMPEQRQEAQERLDAITAMVDAYIKELHR